MTSPIVPQNVLDRYLAHYPAAKHKEIEATYFQIRSAVLNAHTFAETPDRALLMTAGASGAGKSTHLRNKVNAIAEQGGRKYVRLDIDDIIGQFPSFRMNASHLSDYFGECVYGHLDGGDLHGRALRDATNEWVFGAKYIADRILNDCAYLGLPVAFETSAHNDHIEDFFANARANGYSIELDLCDAPLSVKKAESQQRFDRGEAYIDPAEITRKEADVTRNIDRYAANADVLNILWRDRAGQPLVLAATSMGSLKPVIHDQSAADGFDRAHNAQTGITVELVTLQHALCSAKRRRADKAEPSDTPRLVA